MLWGRPLMKWDNEGSEVKRRGWEEKRRDPSDQFPPIITGANLKVTDFLSSRVMAEAEVTALQGRPKRWGRGLEAGCIS